MDCIGPNCDRPVRYTSNGTCIQHYRQSRRGEVLRAIKPKRPQGASVVRNADGLKICTRCDVWMPEDRFDKHPKASDGLNVHCQNCKAQKRRAGLYGMTRPEMDQFIASFGGRCAICSGAEPRDRWAIDHDHTCCPGAQSCGRCVRGLLCARCNLAIGMLNDDPIILRAAAQYIDEFRSTSG